jgi:type II secretory pathway component PulJ
MMESGDAYNGGKAYRQRQGMERALRHEWGFRTVAALAIAAFLLALGDLALVIMNQSTQREVEAQRQFIDQTVQLNQIYQVLVREIARAAVADKDDKLRDVLTHAGIHVEAAAQSIGADPSSAAGNR